MKLAITAILAFRNEARYLRRTLEHLRRNAISVAVIDNASTDDSMAIVSEFAEAGGHLVSVSRLAFDGHFNLSEQLRAKAKVMESLQSDWIIHQDADEILDSPRADESLRDAIERIHSEGYDVANFDEFVFIPTLEEPDHDHPHFPETMLHYYFFEPHHPRLMRAWRNSRGVVQIGGGHLLESPQGLHVYPQNLVLKHYICVSQQHANQKYQTRRYSQEDLRKGWHGNRLHLPPHLPLPPNSQLQRLRSCNDKNLNKDHANTHHFWSW